MDLLEVGVGYHKDVWNGVVLFVSIRMVNIERVIIILIIAFAKKVRSIYNILKINILDKLTSDI